MEQPNDDQRLLKSLSINSQKVLQRNECSNVPSLDSLPKSQTAYLPRIKLNLINKIKTQCSKILSGPWNNLENISIEQKTGGLSNYLYIATLVNSENCPEDTPKKVLIRIYGEILRSNVDSVILDSIVFAILSEKKFGPTLHGVFSGGRIEQYIESRTLSRIEMRHPNIWPLIARKLAKFNSIQMPMNKTNSIIKTLGKFVDQIRNPEKILLNQLACNKQIENEIKSLCTSTQIDLNEEENKANKYLFTRTANFLQKFNLEEEYQWIHREILDVHRDDFTTVFCHNDLQYNNILVAPNKKNESAIDLLLIDFEYCSYNFRGFEIGNVINEWSLDYSPNHTDGFKYIPEAVASLQEQINFTAHYLSEYASQSEDGFLECEDNKMPLDYSKSLAESTIHPVMERKYDDQIIIERTENLLNILPTKMDLYEVQYGILLSHFFWGTWSFIQSTMSNIEFNYIGYAELRLELYQKCKKFMLEEFDTAWSRTQTQTKLER